MNKILLLGMLLAGSSFAADVNFMWLPFMTNALGVVQMATPVTQYGVEVFMNSDNSNVVGFKVVIGIQLADGRVITKSGYQPKLPKVEGVKYSTLYSTLVDTKENFQVMSVTVNGVLRVSVDQPIPGKDYSTGGD